MTGNIGRPGTGANSITGQCNAMGSRLFSNTTNLLGGRDFANAEHRQRSGRAFSSIDATRIPDRPSWAYDQIIEGILRGQDSRACGSSPPTRPIRGSIRTCSATCSARLDFLVVQDMYHTTETAQQADLVLPAAAWGEKEGTFINSERRIGLIKKVARAPGQALADFSIFRLIAEYWGCGEMFRRWTSPGGGVSDCSRNCRAAGRATSPASPTTACSTSAAAFNGRIPSKAHDRLDARAAALRRRPFLSPRRQGEVHLRSDRRRCPSRPTREYPLAAAHRPRHRPRSGTRKRAPRKSAVLRKLYPAEIYVEINPADARRLRHQARTSASSSSRSAARSWPRRLSRPPCSRARSSCRCTTKRPTGSRWRISTRTRGSLRTRTAPFAFVRPQLRTAEDSVPTHTRNAAPP